MLCILEAQDQSLETHTPQALLGRTSEHHTGSSPENWPKIFSPTSLDFTPGVCLSSLTISKGNDYLFVHVCVKTRMEKYVSTFFFFFSY